MKVKIIDPLFETASAFKKGHEYNVIKKMIFEGEFAYNVVADNGTEGILYSSEVEEVIEPKSDPIVESVINQFKTRSEIGIKKYGTTLERNDLSTLDWLKHLQEEMMDAVLYIEKLKGEL